MSMSATFTANSVGTMWNGPVCRTCSTCYLGTHQCGWSDLQRRIDELRDLQDRLPQTPPVPTDRMTHCPCRRENGGSGVCGCVLGGPQITC